MISKAIASVVIALFGAAVLTWASFIWFPAESQTPPPQLYEGVPFDAHLLELDKRALDEAYHNQLLLLFNIWLKQQAVDPRQITKGLQVTRQAYNQAASQIVRREQALRAYLKQHPEIPPDPTQENKP
jgi:hypothetical protein